MSGNLSVIVPAHNASPYVAAALDSVLAQVDGSAQVIVVDDGSTDGTAEVLRPYAKRVQLLRQANRGPAAARNRGLAQASGELVAFIDADDLWTPSRLAAQIAFLEGAPNCAGVIGLIQHLRRDECRRWTPVDEPFFATSLPSGLFRRSVFEKIGELDASLRCCEDLDWFFRARRAGVEFARLREIGLLHRRHATNLTTDRALLRRATLEVIARHRAALAVGSESSEAS